MQQTIIASRINADFGQEVNILGEHDGSGQIQVAGGDGEKKEDTESTENNTTFPAAAFVETTSSKSAYAADKNETENKKQDPVNSSGGPYQLWPVRKDAVPMSPWTHPPRAGRFAVLVLDEPPRRFTLRKTINLFCIKMNLVFRSDDSLCEAQEETDRKLNAFWRNESSSRHADADADADADENDRADGAAAKAVEQGEECQVASTTLGRLWKSLMPLSKEARNARDRRAVETRMRVASGTFRRMFGEDFQEIVPIFDTKASFFFVPLVFFPQDVEIHRCF